MDRRAEHVEAVAGHRDDILVGRRELGAERRARRPAAARRRIVEVGAGLRDAEVIVQLVLRDGLVEHDAIVVEHLADAVRQPLRIDRRLAGARLGVFGEVADGAWRKPPRISLRAGGEARADPSGVMSARTSASSASITDSASAVSRRSAVNSIVGMRRLAGSTSVIATQALSGGGLVSASQGMSTSSASSTSASFRLAPLM